MMITITAFGTRSSEGQNKHISANTKQLKQVMLRRSCPSATRYSRRLNMHEQDSTRQTSIIVPPRSVVTEYKAHLRDSENGSSGSALSIPSASPLSFTSWRVLQRTRWY